VVIHGRSDSTLNRNGVRMGSAEIYAAVEALPEIAEALIIGVEQPDGAYWMPLFVVLTQGATLDESLRDNLRRAISNQVSPRHIPDEILSVPGIPHTRTGKKLEVPIKRLFQGAAMAAVVNPDAVDNAALLERFMQIAQARRASPGASSPS
jgi:acetoacetyl-CoA synthetase